MPLLYCLQIWQSVVLFVVMRYYCLLIFAIIVLFVGMCLCYIVCACVPLMYCLLRRVTNTLFVDICHYCIVGTLFAINLSGHFLCLKIFLLLCQAGCKCYVCLSGDNYQLGFLSLGQKPTELIINTMITARTNLCWLKIVKTVPFRVHCGELLLLTTT